MSTSNYLSRYGTMYLARLADSLNLRNTQDHLFSLFIPFKSEHMWNLFIFFFLNSSALKYVCALIRIHSFITFECDLIERCNYSARRQRVRLRQVRLIGFWCVQVYMVQQYKEYVYCLNDMTEIRLMVLSDCN